MVTASQHTVALAYALTTKDSIWFCQEPCYSIQNQIGLLALHELFPHISKYAPFQTRFGSNGKFSLTGIINHLSLVCFHSEVFFSDLLYLTAQMCSLALWRRLLYDETPLNASGCHLFDLSHIPVTVTMYQQK